MSFSNEDLEGLELPHDDPLMITPWIAGSYVERMLVDTGSSADILFLDAYDRLDLPRELITRGSTTLTGFTGHRISPFGKVDLEVIMGTKPQRTTITVLFTMVDMPHPTYNGMIGRTMLNTLAAVVSPIHLMIKFPTKNGIGCMKGDQKRARHCYHASTRSAVSQQKRADRTPSRNRIPKSKGA